jgi:hypothetical protein
VFENKVLRKIFGPKKGKVKWARWGYNIKKDLRYICYGDGRSMSIGEL